MPARQRAISTQAPSCESIEMLLEDVTVAELSLTATASVDAAIGDWSQFRSVAAAAEPTTYHRVDGLAAMDFGLVLVAFDGMPTLVTVTITAVEISGTVRIISVDRARPFSESGDRTITVVAGTVNDFDRAVRLRGEGLLLMQDAGGSALDPALFARTIEGLDRDGIYAHTSDAVDASAECWYDMRSVRLDATPGTHKVSGSTVSIEAVIEIVESDGTEETLPVLVIIHDIRNALSSPVIELREPGRAALAEGAAQTD